MLSDVIYYIINGSNSQQKSSWHWPWSWLEACDGFQFKPGCRDSRDLLYPYHPSLMLFDGLGGADEFCALFTKKNHNI